MDKKGSFLDHGALAPLGTKSCQGATEVIGDGRRLAIKTPGLTLKFNNGCKQGFIRLCPFNKRHAFGKQNTK